MRGVACVLALAAVGADMPAALSTRAPIAMRSCCCCLCAASAAAVNLLLGAVDIVGKTDVCDDCGAASVLGQLMGGASFFCCGQLSFTRTLTSGLMFCAATMQRVYEFGHMELYASGAVTLLNEDVRMALDVSAHVGHQHCGRSDVAWFTPSTCSAHVYSGNVMLF